MTKFKIILIQLNAFLKSLLYFLRPHILFGFLRGTFLFCYNILSISKWISNHKKAELINDFYSPVREYNKRTLMYEEIKKSYNLDEKRMTYMEFGVCGGKSFFWWLNANKNPNSEFYGFDTFEGLPEKWGLIFDVGDMQSDMPIMEDKRGTFIKGLFQDSLIPFLRGTDINKDNSIKVIHLDADLFTATLFTLTTLFPYLRKGDIILFDEFNSPNHEFYAWEIFVKSFYIEFKLIGAVNNYFQVAVEITKV